MTTGIQMEMLMMAMTNVQIQWVNQDLQSQLRRYGQRAAHHYCIPWKI